MPHHPASAAPERLHVSLVAIPEAVLSTLSGIFDVMNAFAMMPPSGTAAGRRRGSGKSALGTGANVRKWRMLLKKGR